MKYVRWLIAVIILAYVAWIAFPVIRTYLPVDTGPVVMSRQAPAEGGFGPLSVDSAPPASIQGEAAVEAIETGNKPVVWLWGGVVVLYLAAAFLLAGGSLRAGLAYAAAFVADVALTFLSRGEAGSGLFDRIVDLLSGWDPRYILTLVALVLGFIVLLARNRPVPRRRVAL